MIKLFFINFLAFTISVEYRCVAPLHTPPPINGMQVLFAGVILRHGSRTPQVAYLPYLNRGNWVCDSDDAISPRMYSSSISSYRRFQRVIDPKMVEFMPNCRAGDLLIEGMEQHQRLGKLYHEYIYNSINLYDEPPKSEEVYARSTDIERTFRSAQAFLNGAFPPQTPFEYITIIHGSDFAEIMRPGSFCKEQSSASESFYNDRQVIDYAKSEWKKVEHIASALHLTFSVANLSSLADWVYTYSCNNKQLPLFVSSEDVTTCHRILAKCFTRYFEGNGTVYSSYSMREVLRIAKKRLNGEIKAKFGVFSAHDTTLLAFLSFLGHKTEILPPYASHLLFEVFKLGDDTNIRWSFNGDVVQLDKFGGKNFMLFAKFLDKIKNVYEVCHELP